MYSNDILSYSIRRRLPQELLLPYFDTDRINIDFNKVILSGSKGEPDKTFFNVKELYIEKCKDNEEWYAFWLTANIEYINKGKGKLASDYLVTVEQNAYSQETWKTWQAILGDNYDVFIFICLRIIKYINWKKNRNEYYDSSSFDLYVQIFCNLNDRLISYRYTTRYILSTKVCEVEHEIENVTEIDFDDMFHLIQSKSNLILIRELLVEAGKLSHFGSYRSAYLVAYLSLEIATKELIKTAKPGAEYLINEAQLPPLVKLYKNFIDKDIVKVIETNQYNDLKNIAEARNDIAHKGRDISRMNFDRDFSFIIQWVCRIEKFLGKE
ncbi:hypothetical protein CLV58_1671 [Spirosoma oryzae]|uniref:Apea-like HEPN domain-containing protein n=1 Tax=Spirosoma oryzae TaxID=1469603 RepID=A0A2T0REY1_9BACT|nr:hypothetical protein [Spirosoma oryzae]PRY19754.1 hypothetical protein CLV58_1671 [Spirosoma oryzae]